MDPLALHIEDLLTHDGFVRRLALRLIRDEAGAEDVVQDTWLEAVRRPPKATGSARGWLAKVVQHLAANRHRAAGRRARREFMAARSESTSPEHGLLEREETRRQVVAAVLDLGPPYSTVLILRFHQGLSAAEIAMRQAVPVDTVKTQLRRGLGRLREQLERVAPHGDWRFLLTPLVGLPAVSGVGAGSTTTLTSLGVLLMSLKLQFAILLVVGAIAGAAWWAWLKPVENTPAAPRIDAGPVDGPSDLASRPRKPAEPIQPIPFTASADGGAATESAPASREAQVPANRELRGVVLDRTGSTVAGALVIAGDATRVPWLEDDTAFLIHVRRTGEPAPDASPQRDVVVVRSSAAGTFSLGPLTVPATLTLAAWHPAHGVTLLERLPIPTPPPASVTLRFGAAVRLVGRVTDESDHPIKGVRVDIMRSRDANTYTSAGDTVTDADGRFSTAPMAGVAFMVSASADGFEQGHQRVKDIDPTDQERIVDFRLARLTRVRGRILFPSGEPARLDAEAARLLGEATPFETRSQRKPHIFTSGDDPSRDPNFTRIGRAEATLVDEGSAYELQCDRRPVGYVSLWLGGVMIAVAHTTEPKFAPDLILDPSRAPNSRILGALSIKAVSDATNAPIAEFSARIEDIGPGSGGEGPRGSRTVRTTTTDGTLTLQPLPTSTLLVTVVAAGMAPTNLTIAVLPRPAVTEVTARLRPATGSIAGRVVDADGTPVNGARLDVIEHGAGRFVRSTSSRLTTDAEGRFMVKDLACGACVVTTSADGFALASIEAVAEPTPKEVTIRLAKPIVVKIDPKGSSGPLSFRILDAAGIPLRDDWASQTESFGSGFEMPLAPGRYTVEVECPNFETGRETFTAAEGLVVPVTLTPSKR